MNWNLTEAKNRLSEVLDRAGIEGPQRIQRRDDAFVIMPEAQYEVLVADRPSFKNWLLGGPTCDELFLPSRAGSAMRELDL